MRYSRQQRNEIAEYRDGKPDAASLFSRIVRESRAEDRRGGILLVGGSSARDLAVRRAQSPLRFDREPSRWSHAALVLSWPESASPEEIVGAEAAICPADAHLQVPERNGVTLFRASRYMDRARYPNVAFACLCGAEVSKAKDDLVKAALDPSSDRVRFRLWDWLGEWAAASYGLIGGENPIEKGIPMPGAAFCEYAYEAAGIDLSPGASAPNVCPESLWASLLYWSESLSVEDGRMKVWSLASSDAAREALDVGLKSELPAPKRVPRKKARIGRGKAAKKSGARK